jgi:prepilin-type N-terminal cleavage/methylation domain-containing protein
MDQSKQAFTLIELIIVVVIIGILALVAIPKYFANVAKAQRSQAYATLSIIRKAALDYYAAYGKYPTIDTWPITVSLDGDTVINLANPNDTIWHYGYHPAGVGEEIYAIAYKAPTYDTAGCYCRIYFLSGTSECVGSTC